MNPFELKEACILSVKRETADTYTFEMKTDGYAFLPGQFNMLYAFGVGEVPISVSGPPGDPGRIVHTIREVGSVTKVLCKMEKEGVVGLRGPYGSAWPVESAKGRDVVIIAGGLGMAPLRPALYEILSHRTDFGQLSLVYGSRSPELLLFRDELPGWKSRLDMQLVLTVDVADRSWRGHVGLVTKYIPHLDFDPANTTAFVCGPEMMMRFSLRELAEIGIAENNIHLSLERNMKCAVGLCGHCQMGPQFICKDGPVFQYSKIKNIFSVRES